MKVSVLFFLLLGIQFSDVYAQEIPEMHIVGEGELDRSSIISSSVKDVNGRVAAGLVIESDLTGLAFESNNGIIKREMKPGSDLLFLSPDERMVTIYKQGYKPLKIALYDYNIKLKSSLVYKIALTAEKKKLEVPANFLVKPEAAEIFLDGNRIENASTIQILEGKHALEIHAEGFVSFKDSITVNSEQTLFQVELMEKKMMRVQITSEPEMATVFVDDENVGLTDVTFFKMSGKYPIHISKAGFTEIRDTIFVRPDIENLFSFNLINNSGGIHFKLTPYDAELFVNGNRIDAAKTVYLKPGFYEIIAKKDGFDSYSEMIEIRDKEVLSKQITLHEQAGSLDVQVTQSQVKVSLYQFNGDFTKAWIGDTVIDSLPAGKYQIALQLNQYYPIQDEFEILPNERTKKRYHFTDAMLINAPPPVKEAPKRPRSESSVQFYGYLNQLTFKTDVFKNEVKVVPFFESGAIFGSDGTVVTLSYAEYQPNFKDKTQHTSKNKSHFLTIDVTVRPTLGQYFQPYLGLGYLATDMNEKQQTEIFGNSQGKYFMSAFYKYGAWILLNKSSFIDISAGYDFRRSLGSDVKFTSHGWQFGFTFKF